MSKLMDLTEKTFGRLTVVERAESSRTGKTRWLCQCECGKESVVCAENLKSGASSSCGCFKSEVTGSLRLTHGGSIKRNRKRVDSRYSVWIDMKSRCNNPNDSAYRWYGGRGIQVCERWVNNFELFAEDMGACPLGFTLERINNDRSYSQDNCRWVSRAEQSRNKRNNVWVEYQGERKVISDWDKVFGVSRKTIKRRLVAGWSMDQIVSYYCAGRVI